MTKVTLPDSTEVIVSVQEEYILVETETIDFEELKRQAKQRDRKSVVKGKSERQVERVRV